MSMLSRFARSVRHAPTSLSLVPALLALVVVVLAFTDIFRYWDDVASYRSSPPEPAPLPRPLPSPSRQPSPGPSSTLKGLPPDAITSWSGSPTQGMGIHAVAVDSGWTTSGAAALMLTGFALAAVWLVRRRAYGTAALVAALPLLVHVAATVTWSMRSFSGRSWDRIGYLATRPYMEMTEGPQRWLALATIVAGAVNTVYLTLRIRGRVAVRGVLAAQVALGAGAIVLTLIPSVLPGQALRFHRVGEGVAMPFSSAVIVAAVLAAVLHRTRARRLAPVALLAPVVWLVWKLVPRERFQFVDLTGEIGSFPGKLHWASVAETTQTAAWLMTITALLLSAAAGLILARRR
ncbi:hypothetical protein [Actinomadura sp. 6N118]|uniref:hypothetical protein n=1 Tax=Actinomadura sp. 6N118 TaxID=3375151 RepID=UPI0037B4F7D1